MNAGESDASQEDNQTHPAYGVVPAAIAVADALGSSGDALLRATLLGYEMTIRFVRAFCSAMTFKSCLMSSHTLRAALRRGLRGRIVDGLRYGAVRDHAQFLAQEASGLTTRRLDQRHTLKSYVFAGVPATNGVKAAALVRAGSTGGGDALDMTDRNILDAIFPINGQRPWLKGSASTSRSRKSTSRNIPSGIPSPHRLPALEAIIDTHWPHHRMSKPSACSTTRIGIGP